MRYLIIAIFAVCVVVPASAKVIELTPTRTGEASILGGLNAAFAGKAKPQ